MVFFRNEFFSIVPKKKKKKKGLSHGLIIMNNKSKPIHISLLVLLECITSYVHLQVQTPFF
jgi:hypothetical protein